jgi:hypothetical protein
MDAARKGRFAGCAKISIVIPVLGKIGLRVEAIDRNAGDGRKTRLSMLINIDAAGRADRLFACIA